MPPPEERALLYHINLALLSPSLYRPCEFSPALSPGFGPAGAGQRPWCDRAAR